MFMKRIALIISLLLLRSAVTLQAVPAIPYPVEMTMPDGHKMTVTVCGDENLHYYISSDGYPLLPDADGFLRYAVVDNDGIVKAGDIKARALSSRTAAENEFLRSIDAGTVRKALTADLADARSMNRVRQQASSLLSSYPTTGSPKGLIILVAFNDQPFVTPDAHEAFSNLINQPGYSYNGATGSARDYFVDNSRGLFSPEFDVYGPVTLPNSEAYYGRETANMRDSNPYEMVAHACEMLDDEIDFSRYDEDGDGFVDNVFIFYAGYGQNSGAPSYTIWPHAANIWTYGNINLVLDGVQIGNYACTNEIQGTSGSVRAGIGTFCHEFSHVLGLPDLYATDNSSAFTPGEYELMDTGPYLNNGNTPPYMSVYDRMELQWIVPRELNVAETVILKPFNLIDPESDDEALLIKTISDNEYFLLENRQKNGWDAFIPGHGMLVWHIDYDKSLWESNHVNSPTYSQHLRADIVEADNQADALTYAGDPFPGTGNVTSFTDVTTPAMKTWTNILVGKPITNIHEQDGIISFDILGGGERIQPVTALDATDITPVSFTANWTGRSEIFKYEIDLVKGDGVVPVATFVKETASVADCSLEITGLTPSTDYYYVVRAVSADRVSANSARISVRTLPPSFDMFQVTALDATDVNESSFTAHWSPLEGSESYLLSVYTKQFVSPTYDTVDFADGVALPDGWYTNCTSTSAMAGTYGQDKPSLRMTVDNSIIQSREYEFDINSISFWYKGTSDADGTVAIELLYDGAWKEFHSIAVKGNADAVVKYDDTTSPAISAGCRGVRLLFGRNAGSLYLDDITVAYNGTATLTYADGYESADLGDVYQATVSGLQPETQYFYTVTAVKDGVRSIGSAEISVKTKEPSSIKSVVTTQQDGIAVSVAGMTVMAKNGAAAPSLIEVYDISGCKIDSAVAAPEQSVSFSIRQKGVYIIRSGNQINKVML